MNYGLYLSASGALTNLYRQDVYANNLANVETTGFRPDVPTVLARDPEAWSATADPDVSNELLDRLGGGVWAGPQRVSLTVAALEETGRPLDAALTQPNAFFQVAVPGAGGEIEVLLTRDGRFLPDAEGYLSTQSGHRVLDDADRPIPLPVGAVLRIDDTGRVLADGRPVARLGISAAADPSLLFKRGSNLLALTDPAARVPLDTVQVHGGAIETSGADPIATMMRLGEATKAATANLEMIRYHDLMLDRAVNTLGRIA